MNPTAVTVPSALSSHLPEYDTRAPATLLEDGRYLVAGKYALFLVEQQGIVDSGMWYQVQYASWNADNKKLRILWTDPEAPPLTLTTVDDDPKKFMRTLTSRVDNTIVASRHRQLPSGTTVTVTVRRRADGQLFSSVLADGDVQVADEPYLDALENEVRGEVGLGD